MKKKFLLGLVAMALPLTMWAEGLTVKFAESVVKDGTATFEYAGTATSGKVESAVTVWAGEGENEVQLTEGQFILYVTYANSASAKVGSVTVEAYGQGQDYAKLNGSATCQITPKVVNTKFMFDGLGENGVSKVYGESDQAVLEQLVTLDEVRTSLAAGDADAEFVDFLNCLEVARKEGTSNSDYVNEEGYTVFVQGKDGAESNYKYVKPATASYTTLHITPRPLTVILLGVDKETEYTHRAYNAIPLYLETLVSGERIAFAEAEEGKEEGVLEADEEEIEVAELKIVEIDGEETTETKILNAGVYTLQPVLETTESGVEKNYDVQVITFTMDKAEVTIKEATSDASLSSEYTGIAGEIVVSNNNFDFDGLKQTADALNLIVKAVITGDASVTEDGYGFKLYQGEDEETAEEVESEEDEDGIVTYTSGNYTYTFDEELAYMITPKSLGSSENQHKGENITGALKKDENGEFTVFTYTGEDYVENADAVAEKIVVTYANKEPAEGEETEEDVLTLDYDTDYDIVVVAYQDNGKAINAGERFTIAVKGKGNYTGQYNISNITIAQAELQITLKEGVDADMTFKKMEDGAGSGNLAQYFDFTGLVDADSEVDEEGEPTGTPKASVLTMENRNAEAKDDKATKYMIHIWKGQNHTPEVKEDEPNSTLLANYTITKYAKNYYTILPKIDFVLDRDAEGDKSVATLLDTYNGTSPEVKIKQAQVIKEDTWTGLVLPFATTPYEISTAFGYAVVDVPSYNNNNPKEGVFKLNVKDEIKANTLVLIKTYKDRDLEKEPLVFDLKENERVIEYDPDYAFVDAVGIEYHAVYAPVDIKGWEDTYYLSGGNFIYAGERTKETIIKPLSGYVTVPGAGANARIIVEEADGSTTAINAITGESVNYAAEGWYTIDGVKLNTLPTQKGIYINNGKKVVIK